MSACSPPVPAPHIPLLPPKPHSAPRHSTIVSLSAAGTRTHLTLKGDAHTLAVVASSSLFPFFQVFTPPMRDSIALEPMTCNVNAFENGDGLVTVPAAGDWTQASPGVYPAKPRIVLKNKIMIKYCVPALLLLAACTTQTSAKTRPTTAPFCRYLYRRPGLRKNEKAAGIYTCRFDTASGALTIVDTTARGIANPSFLGLHLIKNTCMPWLKTAASPKPLTEQRGRLQHWPFGALTENQRSAQLWGSPLPYLRRCHLPNVLVANYVTGNVVSLGLKADGSLDRFAQHRPAPRRYPLGAHDHPKAFGPGRVLAVDKGDDQVFDQWTRGYCTAPTACTCRLVRRAASF